MSLPRIHRSLLVLAVAIPGLLLPARAPAAPVLEIFEPTGENLFARNIYICPQCTPAQFEQTQVPPGFEASSSSRENVVEAEVLSLTVPPGVAPSLDLSLDIPGDDFFYVARLLDGSVLGFDPVLGPSILAQVERDTVFTYEAGTRIHEATDPQGNVYILFGIDTTSGIDPTQPDALAGVPLPAGWSVSDRVLSSELAVASGGVATVLSLAGGTNFQQYAVVPEPSTALILGLGLAAIASRRRRVPSAPGSVPSRLHRTGVNAMLRTKLSPTPFFPALLLLLIPGPALALPQDPVGHELLDARTFPTIIVWGTTELTIEEYDALVLDPGWLRNEPREGVPDAARFLRTPGQPSDGDFVTQDMFGVQWLHQATVVGFNGPLDPGGLLTSSTVNKYHEVTFFAGSVLTLLISPAEEAYGLISRDARRSTDTAILPAGWGLEEVVLPQELTFMLPEFTTVIRAANNQDSFQGPFPAEVLALVPEPRPSLIVGMMLAVLATLRRAGGSRRP